MRDLVREISEWFASGESVALATVVSTWGSSPRPMGSMMAISSGHKIAGSVSGGCVEGAVVETALEVLGGAPARLLKFGVADETAWDVGLACGGSIEVFVAPLPEATFEQLRSLEAARQPYLAASVTGGPARYVGQMLTARTGEILPAGGEVGLIADWLEPRLSDLLARDKPLHTVAPGEAEYELFIDIFKPPERLVIVGGVHIAIALARLARLIGYETIVIDPRRMFAAEERFPDVDRLIQAWPQEAFPDLELTPSTAVAILTHDPKIDDPAVIAALASPAFYIGVLGSRKTHAARIQRLERSGVTKPALARLHAPIGLDLGAQSPEEIALSILAEIVATRRKH
jgi:xanthine dehydrogenase accessory factor